MNELCCVQSQRPVSKGVKSHNVGKATTLETECTSIDPQHSENDSQVKHTEMVICANCPEKRVFNHTNVISSCREKKNSAGFDVNSSHAHMLSLPKALPIYHWTNKKVDLKYLTCCDLRSWLFVQMMRQRRDENNDLF